MRRQESFLPEIPSGKDSRRRDIGLSQQSDGAGLPYLPIADLKLIRYLYPSMLIVLLVLMIVAVRVIGPVIEQHLP